MALGKIGSVMNLWGLELKLPNTFFCGNVPLKNNKCFTVYVQRPIYDTPVEVYLVL
jgi:hypothetical protein